MYKLKIYSKPKPIKMKCSATFPPIILANLQEKEVIPTKEVQEIVADKTYDGLSKVTVQAIPNEYIVPSGEIEFTQNGTYDVTDKASAKVNIKEKLLGTKTITSNGTYKAINDNLDGYSEVNVETSGVDINEYFKDTISGGSTVKNWKYTLLKFRSPLTIDGTDASYMFYSYPLEVVPDLITTTPLANTASMFDGCENITTIPQLDTSNVTNMASMFRICKQITTIPQLDTSKVKSFTSIFSGCELIKEITLDISSAVNMTYAFESNKNLGKVNLINDNGTITSLYGTFISCYALKELPIINTQNVKDMSGFYNTSSSRVHFLGKKMPKYNLFSCSNVRNIVSTYTATTYDLEDLGGFENLGQAYLTTTQANYSNYTLNISRLTNLTEQSLINVLTNLYDIATKGVATQTVTLGTTNLAKLTSTEGQQALANAQAKGWNIN